MKAAVTPPLLIKSSNSDAFVTSLKNSTSTVWFPNSGKVSLSILSKKNPEKGYTMLLVPFLLLSLVYLVTSESSVETSSKTDYNWELLAKGSSAYLPHYQSIKVISFCNFFSPFGRTTKTSLSTNLCTQCPRTPTLVSYHDQQWQVLNKAKTHRVFSSSLNY